MRFGYPHICIYMLNLHSVFGSFINIYAIFPHIRKYLYRPHTVWGFSMPFHVDMSLSMGITQSAYEEKKNEWPALVPTSPPRSSNCETHLLGGYLKKTASSWAISNFMSISWLRPTRVQPIFKVSLAIKTKVPKTITIKVSQGSKYYLCKWLSTLIIMKLTASKEW